MRMSSAPTREARSDSCRASWSRATTKIRRMASGRSLRRAGPSRGAALEVLDRPPESLVELDLGRVAEQAPRPVDVGLAVPDIAGTRAEVPPLHGPAEKRFDLPDDLEQADPSPAADVENLAGRRFRFSGQDVGLDDVLDLGEVTRLPAVTMDLHGVALERGQDELRNDGRVLGPRVLARPEDVEITQADRLDTVQAVAGGGQTPAARPGDAPREGRRRPPGAPPGGVPGL